MKKVLLLLLALMCTSCTALPAEERAFAVVLCAEKAEGMWQLYARIPAYKTSGEYLTVSGRGGDIASALESLYDSAPMQIQLSQLRLLVLPADIRQDDMAEVMEYLSDQYDVRQECAVAMTDESAKRTADSFKPQTGTRLSKAVDVLLETRIGQGRIPDVTLADILLMGERQSPLLAGLVLQEGNADLNGMYPLTCTGTPLSPMNGDETAVAMLLRGDVKQTSLSLNDQIVRVRDIRVSTELMPGLDTAIVNIHVQLLTSAYQTEAFQQALADACAVPLGRLSAAGCDLLGMGRKAVYHASDTEAWRGLQWQEKLKSLQWEVRVQAEPAI